MTRRKSGHPRIDSWKSVVVGSDEAGYGSLAGPLVVCAASAPIGWDDARVTDSKLNSPKARERLYEEFFRDPRFIFHVVVAQPEVIDRDGVWKTLCGAHQTALFGVACRAQGPLLGVVDGTLPVDEYDLPFERLSLPKADQKVPECSLASIVAKVTHDRLMLELEKAHPGYGFSSNQGYGTTVHKEALRKLGPCPAHRRSYGPVREALEAIEDPQPVRGWEVFDE